MTVCGQWRQTVAGHSAWVERLWKAAFVHRWTLSLSLTVGMMRAMQGPHGWRQKCVARGHIDQNWRTGRHRWQPPVISDIIGLSGDLVVVSLDRDVQVLHVSDGRRIGPPIRGHHCAFLGSTAGVVVLARPYFGPRTSIDIWRFADGQLLRTIDCDRRVHINVVVEPLEPAVAWTSSAVGVTQFDLERGVECCRFGDDWSRLLAVDGHTLLEGAVSEQCVRVWDTRTARPTYRLNHDTGTLSKISVDGNAVMIWGKWRRGVCELWDLRRPRTEIVSFEEVSWAAVAGGRAVVYSYLNGMQIAHPPGATTISVPVAKELERIYLHEAMMDSERVVGSFGVFDFAFV